MRGSNRERIEVIKVNSAKKLEIMNRLLIEWGISEEPINATVETIQMAVCAVFKVSPEELFSSSRYEEIAIARMASMHICRTRLNMSTTRVGEIHQRDHGTVMHASRRVTDMLRLSEGFKKRYELVVKLIEEMEAL